LTIRLPKILQDVFVIEVFMVKSGGRDNTAE
jgi:hypothetical protein